LAELEVSHTGTPRGKRRSDRQQVA